MLTDCFSPSTNLKTFSGLLVVGCLIGEYSLAPKNFDLTMETVLWSINVASPIMAVTVPLFTYQALASCMSTACRVYSKTSSQFKGLPLHLFTFMILAPYATIVYLWGWFFDVFPFWTLAYLTVYNYTYIPVTAAEVVVSCLCFVAEKAFTEIRCRLGPLKHQQLTPRNYTSLKELIETYLEVADLTSKIDNGLSLQLLNIFLSFALRVIVYAAYFIRFSKEKEGHSNDLIVLVVHGIYQTIRLLFLCYRCEKVKEEVSDICQGKPGFY